MKRKQTAISLLLATLVGSTWSWAQPQQEPPRAIFGERLEVTEVLLDVVVTDRAGNIILGLKPEDFIIKDGDLELPAEFATFYSNRRFVDSGIAAERLGVAPDEIPSERYFILFFHDQRPEDPDLTSSFLDALRWAKEWIRFETLANDWVAVLAYDHKLKVYQDFTTQREALLRALDDVAKGRDPGSSWPSRITDQEGPSLRRNLPQGRDLRKASVRVYGALTTFASAAGHIKGRKNLLLFSMGFGRLNDFGTYLPDERYYPALKETLNDNNVAVYSISWIKNLADENPGQSVLNNVLSLLADDTGGRYYFNFVNFKDPLQKVAEDNNGYYLLSYKAQHLAGEQGYREVEVRTTNPDFLVRARKGYRYGP